MDKKYFIGFDKNTSTTTFGYTNTNSIVNYLDLYKLSHSFSMNTSITKAIFTSAMAYSIYAPMLKKMHIPSAILATCDKEDISLDKKGNIVLSTIALNSYKQADSLYYCFDSQLELLRKHGLAYKAEKRKAAVSIWETDTIPDSEKKAFLRFFRIQKDTKLFIAYGSCTESQMERIYSIARNNPEYEFIFFGENDPELMRQHSLNSEFQVQNIQFFTHCPECLYRSMLSSIDALILIDDYNTYPQLIMDVMRFKVPVISYRNLENIPELINEETAFMPKDMGQMIDAFNSLKTAGKTEKAYENIKQYTCSLE